MESFSLQTERQEEKVKNMTFLLMNPKVKSNGFKFINPAVDDVTQTHYVFVCWVIISTTYTILWCTFFRTLKRRYPNTRPAQVDSFITFYTFLNGHSINYYISLFNIFRIFKLQ